MTTYYFTLGSGHHDTRGRSLLGWYTTIEAEDETAARTIYHEKFGDKWSFTYTNPEFQEQIAKYDLRHEPFELLDLCCQAPQEKYLELQRKYEALVNGEPV